MFRTRVLICMVNIYLDILTHIVICNAHRYVNILIHVVICSVHKHVNILSFVVARFSLFLHILTNICDSLAPADSEIHVTLHANKKYMACRRVIPMHFERTREIAYCRAQTKYSHNLKMSICEGIWRYLNVLGAILKQCGAISEVF